jgi:hypothetical protein
MSQFQKGKSLANLQPSCKMAPPLAMCVALYRLNPSKSCLLVFNPSQQIRYLPWTLVTYELFAFNFTNKPMFCLETGAWLQWKKNTRPVSPAPPCAVARRVPARSTKHGARAGSGRMTGRGNRKKSRATSQMAVGGERRDMKPSDKLINLGCVVQSAKCVLPKVAMYTTQLKIVCKCLQDI